jgi:hypothetical protein
MKRSALAIAFVIGASVWGASVSALVWSGSAAWAAPVQAEPATSPAKTQNSTDEPAHRVLLLGATIYGAVSAPNAVYDIPWQEPFLLGKGAGELDRNFLKEIFKPVDREEFLKQSSP